MNTYNRFDRGQDKSFIHEFFDPAEAGWQGHSRESASGYPEMPHLENQPDELSLGKEIDADSDIGGSLERTDSVFAYLRAIRPISVLNRDEEVALAKRIAKEDAEIATKTLCSLLARNRALAMGYRVTTGAVLSRNIVDGSAEASSAA